MNISPITGCAFFWCRCHDYRLFTGSQQCQFYWFPPLLFKSNLTILVSGEKRTLNEYVDRSLTSKLSHKLIITGLMATIFLDKYFNSMVCCWNGNYDFEFWVPKKIWVSESAAILYIKFWFKINAPQYNFTSMSNIVYDMGPCKS